MFYDLNQLVTFTCRLINHLDCSIIELAEKSRGSPNPVSWWCVNISISVARQFHTNDVVSRGTSGWQHTLSKTSLVHGAWVFFFLGNIVFCRLKVNQRHCVVQNVGQLVIDALLLAVPSTTVHIKAVDQDSILWSLFHLAWFLSFDYLERESKLINGDFVLTGMSL